MPFSRSDTAFFHRADVHRLIERVAEQDPLVIYVGAGVSIDMTGLGWQDLIDHLLKKYLPNDETRHAITSMNTPLQAASIAAQLYMGSFGESWRDEVTNELRPLLYKVRKWQRGRLVQEVADLAIALHEARRRFCIVTTNYDGFIEREAAARDVRRHKQGKTKLALRTTFPTGGGRALSRRGVTSLRRIIHLHGYVPESPGEEGSEVVLSEVDYANSNAFTRNMLGNVFANSSVLIIGSSLTDPPLLNALAALANRNGDRPDRYLRLALMPVQGLPIPEGSSDGLVGAIQEHISSRMAQFKVQVAFPDFYSQVSQFLTEVRICMGGNRKSEPYTGLWSPIRYGPRLSSWWREWWEARCRNLARRQREDHARLLRVLKEIENELGAEDETMKLEFWVRWDPSESRRQMRLWASSTGTWPDFRSMRVADIRADSNYISVRTFCNGRRDIYPSDDDRDRWRAYLSLPIRIGRYYKDLPVAVISLATMSPIERSKINSLPHVKVAGIVDKLERLGEDLTATETHPVAGRDNI